MTNKIFRRTLILLLPALILAITGCSQEKGIPGGTPVPKSVLESFTKAHPDAGKVKWETEGAYLAAEYKKDGVETSVLYHKDGSLYATETEIKASALPTAVAAWVASTHSGAKIEEAEKVTYADGSLSYKVEIEGPDGETELRFDGNGAYVGQISDDEGDEGDIEDDMD